MSKIISLFVILSCFFLIGCDWEKGDKVYDTRTGNVGTVLETKKFKTKCIDGTYAIRTYVRVHFHSCTDPNYDPNNPYNNGRTHWNYTKWVLHNGNRLKLYRGDVPYKECEYGDDGPIVIDQPELLEVEDNSSTIDRYFQVVITAVLLFILFYIIRCKLGKKNKLNLYCKSEEMKDQGEE